MSLGMLLRRYLALIAFAFWQGGFTFYAAVVVPIGQAVFGPMEQPAVTREVTVWLNISGVVALMLIALEIVYTADASYRRRLSRWLMWLGMALTLAALLLLHPYLDRMLDTETSHILNRPKFRHVHRVYLWTSTVQWVFGLLYLGLTLWAWHAEERRD
jgi:hypothetical protein